MYKATLTAVTLLVACQHAGAGEGTLESAATAGAASAPKGNADFTWQSGPDASEGDIQATLPDSKRFEGTYLQVTTALSVDRVGPYYTAWSGGWGGPGRVWYAGEADGFVTAYSGKALAHLKSQDGTRMRCTFTLKEPGSGMTGGASGDCQLSDQETIFDAELREIPQ